MQTCITRQKPQAITTAEKPSRTTHPAIPNSAAQSILGVGQDSPPAENLEGRILQRLPAIPIRPQAQIPQAENEADRLSAAVQSGSPESVKAAMGRRMGADFSDVRFHTDSAAASKAGGMGARAFTSGLDVYFGQDGFDPSVAAHELVHTVQQGMTGSETATVSTPAGGIQMEPLTHLNLRQMNFRKHAYKEDEDYQAIKRQMKEFNRSGGSPEARAALMETAMQYIDKFSTGETAIHKGRTAKAEDLLFRLSMDSGQQDAALRNLNRFEGQVNEQVPANEFDQKAKEGMIPALGEMKRMVSGQKTSAGRAKYSKALQMASAGVISRLDNASLEAAGISGTKRAIGSDHYAITGRATVDQADTIGTTLHEMTHAASGNIYDNTTAYFTIGQDAGGEAVRARRDDNARRARDIAAAAARQGGAKKITDRTSGDLRGLASWADGRKDYGTGGKMQSQYIPGEKMKMMRSVKEAQGIDMSGAGYSELRALLPEYEDTMAHIESQPGLSEAAVADMKTNDAGFRQMESALGGISDDSDALIEYDPVINQMLSEYESASDDRESEFYRKTKAAVLRSHVNRQKHLLMRQSAEAR